VKRIDSIVRPHCLDVVKERLVNAGIEGMTVTEVRGFGRQKGHTEVYRGSEYRVDFVPKIMITILVSDERVVDILTAIAEAAHTGALGDGKIFVTPLDEVIRIRTGDRGGAAI
jgi:nitrogen regulatory protein P-II 1